MWIFAYVFWLVAYILSWIAHGTWVLWGMYLAGCLGIEQEWKQVIATFVAWVIIVILSAGCPFLYLHQGLEMQLGWRKKITYHYEDSIVYQYMVRPINDIVGALRCTNVERDGTVTMENVAGKGERE